MELKGANRVQRRQVIYRGYQAEPTRELANGDTRSLDHCGRNRYLRHLKVLVAMCCLIEVHGRDDEGESIELRDFTARSTSEDGILIGEGHDVDPAKLMLIVKQAVGFALSETRAGREGVFIRQLGDPCQPAHCVEPPFNLEDFCLADLHERLDTEATGYNGLDPYGNIVQ